MTKTAAALLACAASLTLVPTAGAITTAIHIRGTSP
jgi:hypothetical protein